MRFGLILSFVLVVFCSHSQPDYFADNPEWYEFMFCHDGTCFQEHHYIIYIDGDSTINSTAYKKVYKGGYWLGSIASPCAYWCNNHYSYYHEFQALIRQDSMAVYIWNDSNEVLLYDYDLSVGDTLPSTIIHPSTTSVVDSVGTIMINGTQRRHIFFSDTNSMTVSNYLKEGIGTNNGFNGIMSYDTILTVPFCGSAELRCFKVNNQIEIGTDCKYDQLIVGQSEVLLPTDIEISPNPVQSKLLISFPENQTLKQVICHSMKGKSIEWDVHSSNGQFQIDVSNLEVGLYLIELQFADGSVNRKRFIRSN